MMKQYTWPCLLVLHPHEEICFLEEYAWLTKYADATARSFNTQYYRT